MAAGKTPPNLRQLLVTLLLSCLLLALAPVRAFEFDCANEVRENVAVLSFCNGDGWRYSCLYGGGYSKDGSGECTRVQAGAIHCEDCEGNAHELPRCCDIDLSGYELSAGIQANTGHDTEWGITILQCPGNSDCHDFGYPQCNGGGFDGINPYWIYQDNYDTGYEYCPESSGAMLRALEPRAHSSGEVQLRELERPVAEIRAEPPRPIAPLDGGARAGGKTKMSRRLWGSGRPWSPPKMYSRRLWGSGRPMYSRRLWGRGRPWSPPKMYSRRLGIAYCLVSVVDWFVRIEIVSQVAGILDIHIIQAEGLRELCDYGPQDVYARVLCGERDDIGRVALTTKTIKSGGNNPIFNQRLQVGVPERETEVKCEIWMASHHRGTTDDQLLGFIQIPIRDIMERGKAGVQEFYLRAFDEVGNLFASSAKVRISLSYHPRPGSSNATPTGGNTPSGKARGTPSSAKGNILGRALTAAFSRISAEKAAERAAEKGAEKGGGGIPGTPAGTPIRAQSFSRVHPETFSSAGGGEGGGGTPFGTPARIVGGESGGASAGGASAGGAAPQGTPGGIPNGVGATPVATPGKAPENIPGITPGNTPGRALASLRLGNLTFTPGIQTREAMSSHGPSTLQRSRPMSPRSPASPRSPMSEVRDGLRHGLDLVQALREVTEGGAKFANASNKKQKSKSGPLSVNHPYMMEAVDLQRKHKYKAQSGPLFDNGDAYDADGGGSGTCSPYSSRRPASSSPPRHVRKMILPHRSATPPMSFREAPQPPHSGGGFILGRSAPLNPEALDLWEGGEPPPAVFTSRSGPLRLQGNYSGYKPTSGPLPTTTSLMKLDSLDTPPTLPPPPSLRAMRRGGGVAGSALFSHSIVSGSAYSGAALSGGTFSAGAGSMQETNSSSGCHVGSTGDDVSSGMAGSGMAGSGVTGSGRLLRRQGSGGRQGPGLQQGFGGRTGGGGGMGGVTGGSVGTWGSGGAGGSGGMAGSEETGVSGGMEASAGAVAGGFGSFGGAFGAGGFGSFSSLASQGSVKAPLQSQGSFSGVNGATTFSGRGMPNSLQRGGSGGSVQDEGEGEAEGAGAEALGLEGGYAGGKAVGGEGFFVENDLAGGKDDVALFLPEGRTFEEMLMEEKETGLQQGIPTTATAAFASGGEEGFETSHMLMDAAGALDVFPLPMPEGFDTMGWDEMEQPAARQQAFQQQMAQAQQQQPLPAAPPSHQFAYTCPSARAVLVVTAAAMAAGGGVCQPLG
ncbi:unnamed protein product [Closterium sp. Yama58-4]|nr:unnamed protein product [Closterium sp. Yama58-4]